MPGAEDPDDFWSFIFIAAAGNVAHLHYDGDLNHALLYQVFGVKRVILFPVQAARKLAPLLNYASVMLEHFTEEDKAAFIRYAGGYDCLLYPGETLYLPATMWHYMEYTDLCMSFNLRWGRNPYTRFLSQHLETDLYLQGIAAKMIDPAVVKQRYQPEFRRLQKAYAHPYPTVTDKYWRLQRIVREIYERFWPEEACLFYSFAQPAGFFEHYSRYLHEQIVHRLEQG